MMLNVGLIGCGQHGRSAVVPAITRSSKQCRLIAVADRDPQAVESLCRDDARRYLDVGDLLADPEVHVVYLATLADSHCELAIAAFEAGLHVVCEKPMAPTLKQCRRMMDAAEASGRKLVINFENRYLPHNMQLRKWIQQGRLGRVEAVHLQQFWDGHKSFGPIAARRARLLEIAGALDCGIHKLDLARFLVGGRWSHIHAVGAWLGESFEPPSHISILGQLDSRVMVSVNASLGYASAITPRPMQDVLTVVGTEGVASLCIDSESPEEFHAAPAELRLFTDQSVERARVVHLNHRDAIGLLLDDLATHLHGLPTLSVLPDGEDGLQAQLATIQANASACRHRAE